MITARNYAAQAEASLRKNATLYPKARYAEIAHVDADIIKQSVHFVIEDGGKIFDDGFTGLEQFLPKLPFNKITIEFYVNQETNINPSDVSAKCVVIASQDGDNIRFTHIDSNKTIKEWVPSEYFAIIRPDFMTPNDGTIPVLDWESINDGLIKKAKTPIRFEAFSLLGKPVDRNDISGLCALRLAATALLELLEALSCRNVATVNYQDGSPANASRIKASKLPIYETKMLVVDTRATISESGEYKGGSHSSPRQHLRRGHIRRLPKGNIWVQSCVVGDASKDKIDKQYLVK